MIVVIRAAATIAACIVIGVLPFALKFRAMREAERIERVVLGEEE